MTVLGKHTVVETRDLMKLIEFRARKNQDVFNQIPASFIQSNLNEFQRLNRDWDNWKARWSAARDKVADELVMINVGQPLVSADILTAESQYKAIEVAAQVDNGKKNNDTDMMQLMIRTEQAAGITFDEKNQPLPTQTDFDLAAFKKVDAAIKSGESAANDASKAVGKAAKSNVGLMIGGGVALVLAGGILAKVYLP